MNMQNKKVYQSLWFWVLVFMFLGMLFGVLAPNYARNAKPIIDGFIAVIKILVGPIIFLTVVSGIIGIGSLRQLGSIGLKAFIYFETISTISLVVGLLFGYFFNPGSGMNLSVAQMDPLLIKNYVNHSSSDVNLVHILLNAIPHNIIDAFIQGNTLQILFIAIVTGFVIFFLGVKVQNYCLAKVKYLQHVMFKVLSYVMLFSPVAAFAAMSFMIGQFGIHVILSMVTLVLTMIGACIFFILVVLGVVAKIVGFKIIDFLKLIKDEIILVFATSSSESALGPIMHKLTKNGVSDSVVGIVVPAGYSFNLDGTNIYLALVIAFLCNAFNIHLQFEEYIMVILVLMATSKGAAGVSGSGFIVLAGTLSAMHGKIPVETICILLGIDKIMSELRSVTNLIGNSVATVAVAKWDKQLDMGKFLNVLKM